MIAFLILLLASCLQLGEMRTWKTASGDEKIEGRFVRTEDGKVTIKRKTGKLITVPILGLCEADRNYIDRTAVGIRRESEPSMKKDAGAAAKKDELKAVPITAKDANPDKVEDDKSNDPKKPVKISSTEKSNSKLDPPDQPIVEGSIAYAHVKFDAKLYKTLSPNSKSVPSVLDVGKWEALLEPILEKGGFLNDADPIAADVLLKEKIVVKGVPERAIRGFARHLKSRLLSQIGDFGARDDTDAVVNALVSYWLVADYGSSAAARDTLMLQANKASAKSLSAHALLFPLVVAGRAYGRVAFHPKTLLERFPQEVKISTASARLIAEELIWTNELGISDGKLESLPYIRRKICFAVEKIAGPGAINGRSNSDRPNGKNSSTRSKGKSDASDNRINKKSGK